MPQLGCISGKLCLVKKVNQALIQATHFVIPIILKLQKFEMKNKLIIERHVGNNLFIAKKDNRRDPCGDGNFLLSPLYPCQYTFCDTVPEFCNISLLEEIGQRLLRTFFALFLTTSYKSKIILNYLKKFVYLFIYLFIFTATPVAYDTFQARLGVESELQLRSMPLSWQHWI